jgi:hypothetical protein
MELCYLFNIVSVTDQNETKNNYSVCNIQHLCYTLVIASNFEIHKLGILNSCGLALLVVSTSADILLILIMD